MTTKMKAVTIHAFGGANRLQLETVNVPQPADDEVQIKVEYAAVNPVDWKIREGYLKDFMPHEFPIILGWDAAGVISAVGKNSPFAVGDEVFAYCRKPTIQWGTYAEYVCVNAQAVALKPRSVTFAEAAALPLAGLTAWQSLFDAAHLKAGESVLIQAGAGGVGSLAIQFAKNAGAFVITTGSRSNRGYLEELGADLVIDYKENDVFQAVKKAFPLGIDVVFDMLGAKIYEQSFSLLKKNGRIVSLLEQPNAALEKQYDVKAFYVFVSPNGQELKEIARLIDTGKISGIPVQEFPLEEAYEAQNLNQQGHVKGKIVLKIK